MNAYLAYVVTSVLIGIVCAIIAYRVGKDPLRWFFFGVLLNVLALGLIMFVKNRREHVASEPE